MLKAPTDSASLIDPDAWWDERRVLSRELVDQGDMKMAYGSSPLMPPKARPTPRTRSSMPAGTPCAASTTLPSAARHFSRIAEIADGPISLSRAYYWLGRAAEAGGPGNAKDYFARAATYGTTFYGQLAAERIGQATRSPRPILDPVRRRPAKLRATRGRQRHRAPRTGRRRPLADTLYRDLAAQLTSPGELALLAAMAEKRGNHFLALKVGKIAGARGIEIGALSHPIGAIPASANISGSGKALAYAIARQESEFNVIRRSPAPARAGCCNCFPAPPGRWPSGPECRTRRRG